MLQLCNFSFHGTTTGLSQISKVMLNQRGMKRSWVGAEEGRGGEGRHAPCFSAGRALRGDSLAGTREHSLQTKAQEVRREEITREKRS